MESDNQNSPKRSWSQIANELRGRYLRYVDRGRGSKFLKQWKIYLVLVGAMFIVASPALFWIGMFEAPDRSENIALRFLNSVIVSLVFFLPGVIAIYTGLGSSNC